MGRIQVLPPNIANKIAAGEVVDRPASVVKELIENALDAGATKITVVLQQAGKELIQVIDDGCGMDEEDAQLAFQRHATSKIHSLRDLDQIRTLGFRGEALPSIASVARLELKTRMPEQEMGIHLKLEGGKITAHDRLALPPGTTVTVKNLFYNTPARRNFLKSDQTELNHILRTLKRFFLAFPNITFRVHHNNEEIFHLPATSLDQRITDIFGENFYQGLIHITDSLGDIHLEGYVSRPDQSRGNTENQFIFLNQRAIINRNLAHAVFQGYGNLIERGRYPQFILYLTSPPNLIDVNVHPTKMEVRFANERAMYHLFLSAVRKAVQSPESVPEFELSAEDPKKREIRQHFRSHRRYRRPGRIPIRPISSGVKGQQLSFSYTIPEKDAPAEPLSMPNTQATQTEAQPTVQANLWQVHNRYIFSQVKSGLVIIDQHVAHERILYEKILEHLQNNKTVPSQQLLFPQTLELPLEDYLVFQEIKDWLNKIGFSISELSGRTIIIEAIPADVRVGYEGKVLLEMIDYFRENEDKNFPIHQKIAAAYACKNAIKSGEKLSIEAMNALVDQLFATKEPFYCPHGRPVIVNISLEELDRKFKRIK